MSVVDLRTLLEKFPVSVGMLGIPFGAAMGTYSKIDGASTRFAVIGGAISGLFFGIAMTLVFRRQRSQYQQALGEVPPQVLRAAGRALRGPVPADPEVRAAAIRLAEYRLGLLRRWRTSSLILWVVLLVLNLISLLGEFSLWRLVTVASILLLVAYQFVGPRRLRARIALLESAEGLQQDGAEQRGR